MTRNTFRMPASAKVLDLHDVIELATAKGIELWLASTPEPGDRTDQLADLSDAEVIRLASILTPETGAELLESVDLHSAIDALTVMPRPVSAGLLDALDPDLSAEMLREIDDEHRGELLGSMAIARSAVVRGLLAWPEDSAAARMTPEAITVRPTMTTADAIESLRSDAARLNPDSHTSAYIFVTGPNDHLLGVVSFRDLVLASNDTVIADLMTDDVISVAPQDDQEEAARVLIAHRLLAIPVVDDGVLLGIITADDVADIVAEETTEDAERQGGSAPLDVPYLRASPIRLWRKRIVWLLALFIAEMYTGTVMRAYEDELSSVVALAFFVPLLIGTGGNSGTQITTTLIRAMATGQVRLRNVFAVVRKELTTGLLIAVTMAAAAWIRAWTLGVGFEVALTVTVAVAAIVVWSSLIASVLPLVLKKLRIDPAVVSGPMISTLVDGTGLIIYFSIAKLLISSLG